MGVYTIQVVCEAGEDPLTGEWLPREEETFLVEAPTIQRARTLATRNMGISARGRLLRCYDTEGNELLGDS